jgi:hypothetical protein
MEPSVMEITTIGVDLAKSIFQVRGVDAKVNLPLAMREPSTEDIR